MAAWDAEFETFAVSRSAGLLRSAYLLAGDTATAEDLVQTALTRMYVVWPRLVRRDELDGYARTVVVRTFLDEKRRPWRRERPSSGSLPEHPVEDIAESTTTRVALLDALRSLPPRQRAVVVLRVWEDMSVDQTAQALDISAGTVKSQLSKSLEALRRHPALAMADDGEAPGARRRAGNGD